MHWPNCIFWANLTHYSRRYGEDHGESSAFLSIKLLDDDGKPILDKSGKSATSAVQAQEVRDSSVLRAAQHGFARFSTG
jgi:hypothetical protein